MKILIVEDDAMMLKALKQFLTKAGYQVTTASDGMKALEIFQSDKSFDLIITDIMMPEISGFSLLSTIREFEKGRIPAIFISSSDKVKTVSDAFKMDVDDVIIKPIDFNALLLKITKLLHVKN